MRGAVAGVEACVPGPVQGAEGGAGGGGLRERVGDGVEVAGQAGMRGQGAGHAQRGPQYTVVPDVRLPVEGADVQLIQPTVATGHLGRDVQTSPQDRFEVLTAYVVAAQPFPDQLLALFQQCRSHEVGVAFRAGGPAPCGRWEGRRSVEGVGEPVHQLLTRDGELGLDDQADPVEDQDADGGVGLEPPSRGGRFEAEAAAPPEGSEPPHVPGCELLGPQQGGAVLDEPDLGAVRHRGPARRW